MAKKQKKAEEKAVENGSIDSILDKYAGDAGSLIKALLEIQEETRWLSKEILEKVSTKLDVPLSKVQHAATFYKAFNVIPEGRHQVHVCNGTSCHANGSSHIIHKVEEITGIKHGKTDPDFKFSLKAVTCLGCCSSGPGMKVDGKYHGSLDPAVAEDVLKECD
ncbi:complex I 24 kDa subunit family protein [Chloroflexota bacterium]